MSGYVTSTQETASFYRTDPELAMMLPKKPRLIGELKFLPFRDDDLMVVGGYTIQVFKGKGARALLPALRPYLTGHWDLDELEQQVPANLKGRVFEIVTLLANKGLLEDGISQQPAGGLASYLGRFINAGRSFSSRETVLTHLQAQRLAVFADAAYLPQLQGMLADLPVATAQYRSELADAASLDANIVLLLEGPDFQQNQQFCQQLRDRGIVVFYASLSGKNACIGPLFDGKLSVSYQSLRERIALDQHSQIHPADLQFWLGNICHEFTNYLAKVSQQTVFNVCKHYELGEQVEGVPVKVSPMPGVSDGSLAHLPRLSSSKAEALWELHNSFRMPPKAYIGESFHLQHYKASNRSLTVSGKPRFYSKISYQLPEGRALPQFFAVASDDRVMTLQQLADLLMYSYGYQQVNGQPRLLPPTGGGLSSPEAYLTIHSLDGVPDGRYHYDARSHSLEFLGELNADRICSMLQVDRLPQVLLFGVASLHRVRAKYGNSAFKITNLDAGVAQTYIRQVALRLGLPQRSYQQWYSAGLMDELFIPHRENRFVLTHISGLGGQREPERYSDDMLGHFLSMRPSSQRTSWQEPADRIATQAGFDLSRVMKQRRAVRDFRPQALQLSSVLQLLADTVSLSAELQRHQQLSLQVNYWVVVRYDMPDHPAGLYRYQPDSQQLLPVYTQPDLDFGRFANQTSLTEAPVLLVFSANLFDILNREEDYGYKAMWQHIGQLAADLWLRSCAAGYVGTIAGGALEEALLTYGQTDGLTDAVLALFAFGHEREAQS